MKERLREYLDKLFTDVPLGTQSNELREEIYANLCDKYDNLLQKGMTEEEAYYSTIASIGNIDELLGELQPDTRNNTTKKERERSAVLRSLAGACPFLGVAGFFAGLFLVGNPGLAFLMLFVFIGAGVAMNSFAKLSSVPGRATGRRTYIKGEEGETVVEEFKEFRRGKSRNEQLKSTVLTCMWMLIVIAYFVISFTTMAWYISWIIFLIGVALSQAIKCYFNLKDVDDGDGASR